MEEPVDTILQPAREASPDDLSDVEIDADGSSSLSEIEDKDADEADDMEVSDDELSNISDEENDSEAETERLEDSPHKFRQQQDVVLSSRSNNNNHPGYSHSPSKLHKEIGLDNQEDEEEELSSEDLSGESSPKSSTHDEAALGLSTTTTSLEDSSREDNKMLSAVETDTRKRKRSIMAGSGLDEDNEESPRKRTGSIMAPDNDYAIEDEPDEDAEADTSNGVSGNISGEEGGIAQPNAPEEVDEPAVPENIAKESTETITAPRKRGRRKKKGENGNSQDEDETATHEDSALNGDNEPRNGVDHEAENEGDDEADLLSKDEEELEKKRIALEQLSAIESQFTTFRERLYQERLQQLNREEAMLRQPNPTHPEYLAMMQSIDARRDEKFRVADKIKEYQMQSLKNFAVSRRSQILSQYQQEVREIREKKLEQLGKQWYEIQHDRRNYAGSVPEYTLKFPAKKSQQIQNQVAYSKEVSILSGVAKYVGFPAAPTMAPTTAEELEEDLERMGRTRPAPHRVSSFPMQELAALRSAGSTSRFKPAEEQFIEQTPWANPQHPSHAHLIQRQSSAQQIAQTPNPFSQVQVQPARRNSPYGVPISGIFTSTSSFHNSNGVTMPAGRVSPHNSFTNSNLSHAIAPSPLGSRQPSLSPQQNRHPPIPEHQTQEATKTNGIHHPPLVEPGRDLTNEVRREQTTAMMTRF